jgi:hypothetical protein
MKAMSKKMMENHNSPYEHTEAFRRYGIRKMMQEMDSDS